jgi:hypothetical protein
VKWGLWQCCGAPVYALSRLGAIGRARVCAVPILWARLGGCPLQLPSPLPPIKRSRPRAPAAGDCGSQPRNGAFQSQTAAEWRGQLQRDWLRTQDARERRAPFRYGRSPLSPFPVPPRRQPSPSQLAPAGALQPDQLVVRPRSARSQPRSSAHSGERIRASLSDARALPAGDLRDPLRGFSELCSDVLERGLRRVDGLPSRSYKPLHPHHRAALGRADRPARRTP